MSSEYVRVTFIGLRAPGDISTNQGIRDALFTEDCGKLDIFLDDIRSVTVEDLSEEDARVEREADEDETPAWAIDAQQDEREAIPSGLEAPARR